MIIIIIWSGTKARNFFFLSAQLNDFFLLFYTFFLRLRPWALYIYFPCIFNTRGLRGDPSLASPPPPRPPSGEALNCRWVKVHLRGDPPPLTHGTKRKRTKLIKKSEVEVSNRNYLMCQTAKAMWQISNKLIMRAQRLP